MVNPSAHASHILVKSKGEATQLASNITKLKDFQKTARKKSDCPSSQRGGDLGWFRKGQMVREFDTFKTLRDAEYEIGYVDEYKAGEECWKLTQNDLTIGD